MRVLQFDSVGGASGDMILAALIDLGISRDKLQSRLANLPVGPFDICAVPFSSQGLRGIRVNVHIGSGPHTHDEKGACRSHPFQADGADVPDNARGLGEIRTLLRNTDLPESVKGSSLKVFQRLAEAEARVHGTTPDQVHFHEVGGVDSIVDIVGSCLALDMLDINEIAVGPLPLGCGTMECCHGILPIPAPATVELLKGAPVVHTKEPFELVTPTGAALLSTWKTMDRPPPGSRIIDAGYGIGHRTLTSRPNLIRALLLESAADTELHDECLVLECNIDDTTPELLGSLSQKLMKAEALDVFMSPVQMKKQRPGILLTVLCRPDQRDMVLDLIFRESTTFGIREYPVKRTTLNRSHELVETKYGSVSVKMGVWQGEVITRMPEHEDCVRLAQEAGVPVRAVYEAALRGMTNDK